jgi:hypothetical protein
MAIAALAYLGYLLPTLLQVRLPWGIEVALIALPFYTMGQFFSLRKAWHPQAGKRGAFLLLFFTALQFVCVALNGRVDMNSISLGNPLLFYCGAVSGIGALACLVAFLPSVQIFSRLADAAVLAFPMHRAMFSFFSAFGMLLLHDLQAFKHSGWGSVSYTVGALLLSVILLPWVRLRCPIFIGGR